MPKVAICILTYNGKAILQEFLPSVMKITYSNAEIIVIDNKSEDDTIAFLKTQYPTIKIVQNTDNKGFAGGYNEGLKNIKADYFVLLNNDVEVTPNFIEPIITAMQQNEKIAVAQPKIKSYHKKTHFEYAGASGGFLDFLGYPFCRGRIFDNLEVDKNQYDLEHECAWASGCAFFIKSKLWHKFGGFDEDFFAHMEEIDLCWRLKNAGYQNFVYPQSVVYHLGGGTLNYESPNKTFLNFRNNLFMLHKNLPKGKLHLIFLRLILDGVAAIKELFSFKFAHFLAVLKAHLHFYKSIGKNSSKRKKITQLIDKERIAERNECCIYNKSIVWQYFVKGKKRYSDLK